MRLLGNNQEQKLRKKYKKLLQEAYELSKTDRKRSDAMYAEAEKVIDEITQAQLLWRSIPIYLN